MGEWPVSPQRRAVLGAVAAAVLVLRSAGAVRVAVDGVDGAGKDLEMNNVSNRAADRWSVGRSGEAPAGPHLRAR
ncbi:MAG: hypothetical protein ACYDB7_03900, partial [Mycobacteriales bacterium]